MASPILPIGFSFFAVRLSIGNDPDDEIAFPITMADDERPKPIAKAEHDEAILIRRVVRIDISNGPLVIKYGLSLLEGDSVLSAIRPVLFLIPGETDLLHIYIVNIFWFFVNAILVREPKDARIDTNLLALAGLPVSRP
jgi:hypothetical protein